MTMSDPLKDLGERIKSLGSNWTAYTVAGSFLLYVLGYLALRFHLTALGVSTDLAVLDERYLFTGARFLVYLAAALPSVVLILLLLGAAVYLPYRLLPAAARAWLGRWAGRLLAWATRPGRLGLAGIAFSVLAIQFLMRDCFELNDLLLRQALPWHNRLAAWLGNGDEARIALFFTALLACAALSALILLKLYAQAIEGAALRARQLLAVLVGIQCLLLPVNFGYLVLDKSLPRVDSLDGTTPLDDDTRAWLVWEGKEGMTFLTRGSDKGKRLVTLPRGEVKRIEILANDPIVPTLYARKPDKTP